MEIVKSEKVSALIDYAADLLEMHGWTRGELYAGISDDDSMSWPDDYAPVEDGEYKADAMCTEGALRAADLLIHTDVQYPVQTEVFTDAFYSVRTLLPDFEMLGRSTATWTKRPSIAMWNDHACCSREQAVEFLRDCAIKTRPDESRVGVAMSE